MKIKINIEFKLKNLFDYKHLKQIIKVYMRTIVHKFNLKGFKIDFITEKSNR